MRMRGDRRSSSFRKEKPAGLSRALSWLSVSTLSRQSRRIFHSQNELHAIHDRQAHLYSHTHLHAADRDEEDDDDNWVYQPQHKIGERGEKRVKSALKRWSESLLIDPVCWVSLCRCTPTKPRGMFVLAASQLVTMLGTHLNGFLFSFPTRKPVNDLFTCTSNVRSGSLSFYGPLFSICTFLALPGCYRERAGGGRIQRGCSGVILCVR